MDASSLLCDCIEFIELMGKSKNILIHSYDEEAGLLVLRNTKGRKVTIKVNKGSNSFDIGVFICPYKNDSVEVLHPYKKKVREGLNGLISIVDDAFKELN